MLKIKRLECLYMMYIASNPVSELWISPFFQHAYSQYIHPDPKDWPHPKINFWKNLVNLHNCICDIEIKVSCKIIYPEEVISDSMWWIQVCWFETSFCQFLGVWKNCWISSLFKLWAIASLKGWVVCLVKCFSSQPKISKSCKRLAVTRQGVFYWNHLFSQQ